MNPASPSPQRPVLWVALALAAGSALGSAAFVHSAPALGLAFAALAAAGAVRAPRMRLALLLGALAILEAARSARPEERASGPIEAGRWHAEEARNGNEHGSAAPSDMTFELAQGVCEEGAWVQVERNGPLRRPARGPVADPREEHLFANPGRGPLHELLPDELVRVEPAGVLRRAAELVARLRALARARLARLEDPCTRGLCAALLLGDTTLFEREEEERYVRTGTYHLLAVSGTQVVLLTWLAFLPLARALAAFVRRVAGRAPRAELFAAPLIALYVPLAGAGAPVLRAAVVFALVPFTPRSPPHGVPRRCDALTLWAAALAFECACDPHAASSVSVQLSYSATLGLILASGALLAKLHQGLGPPGLSEVNALGRARPEALCVLSARVSHGLRTATAASVVAVIATAPFVLSSFQEFCPTGIVSTVLLLPPTGALLALAGLVAFAGVPLPQLWLDVPAHLTSTIVEAFDALPLSPWVLPPRPFLLWCACSALALCALRSHAPRARTYARLAALVCGTALLPWTLAPAQTEIVALDVGHGTCVCAREPDGSAWIFDAGSRDRPGLGRAALEPLLAQWDPTEVRVVLSHAERDHDGALPWIVERFAPDLWAGAVPAHLGERIPHACPRIDLAQPGLLQLSPGAWLLRGARRDDNEGSRSLVLERAGELIWLSGDAEEAGLQGLLRAWPVPSAPVRLLLVPHHGSESVSLGALLEQLAPREAWISSSEEAPAAAEILRRRIPLRWTAREGPLELEPRPP